MLNLRKRGCSMLSWERQNTPGGMLWPTLFPTSTCPVSTELFSWCKTVVLPRRQKHSLYQDQLWWYCIYQPSLSLSCHWLKPSCSHLKCNLGFCERLIGVPVNAARFASLCNLTPLLERALTNKIVISFPNEQTPSKAGLRVMVPCGPWCTGQWKKMTTYNWL